MRIDFWPNFAYRKSIGIKLVYVSKMKKHLSDTV